MLSQENMPIFEIPEHLVPSVESGYPVALLDDEQRELLKEFQSKIQPALDTIGIQLTPSVQKWMDEACMLRYLRATLWNVTNAVDRIISTICWRIEYLPDQINLSDIEIEARSGKQVLSGFDKGGRPLMYLIPQRENTRDYDNQLKYTVYGLEKAIERMPHGVEQLVLVIDYEKIGMTNAPPLSVSRRFLQIVGDHYPDRLHKAFLINPSWYLWILMKMIRPFLDPVTASKINLVDLTQVKKDKEKPAGTAGYSSILDSIDADQLLKEYGGEFEWQWDFDSYWKLLNEE